MIVYRIFLVICTSFLFAVTLSAQDESAEENKTNETVTVEQQQEVPEKPVVDDKAIKLFLDKIEVVGSLEKPQAVFIIPGKNPEIDDIRIERSFFSKIFRPVEKRSRFISETTVKSVQTRKDYIPW